MGLTLFVNTERIDWRRPDEAVPAFFVLLLIPFTYSIIAGVGVGYVLYVAIGLLTGRLQEKCRKPSRGSSSYSGYSYSCCYFFDNNRNGYSSGLHPQRQQQWAVHMNTELSPHSSECSSHSFSGSDSSGAGDDLESSTGLPPATAASASAPCDAAVARGGAAARSGGRAHHHLLHASLWGRARRIHSYNPLNLSPQSMQQQQHQQQHLHISSSSAEEAESSCVNPLQLHRRVPLVSTQSHQRQRQQQSVRRGRGRPCGLVSLTDRLPMDFKNSIKSIQFSQQQ